MTREHIIHFTYGGMLTVDSMQLETEVGPKQYRAYYNEFPDGRVCITQIDRCDLVRGHEDWRRDGLGRELVKELEHKLEDQIAAEHEALVDLHKIEQRRFA